MFDLRYALTARQQHSVVEPETLGLKRIVDGDAVPGEDHLVGNVKLIEEPSQTKEVQGRKAIAVGVFLSTGLRTTHRRERIEETHPACSQEEELGVFLSQRESGANRFRDLLWRVHQNRTTTHKVQGHLLEQAVFSQPCHGTDLE